MERIRRKGWRSFQASITKPELAPQGINKLLPRNHFLHGFDDIISIMEAMVKIVVFVPKSHSNIVRKAIGDAGAGKIGNYGYNSFSVVGTGRFKPLEGAKPYIGKKGKLEKVEEERIEFVCEKDKAKKVISEISKVHPYEEVAVDINPIYGEDECKV